MTKFLNMKKTFYFIILIYLTQNIYSQQITVTYNNDTIGSVSNLQDAKNFVATFLNNTSPLLYDVYVNIPSGTYTLTQPLSFTSADSGKNGYRVIYRGINSNNKPIISGGYQVTNWTPHDSVKNIWKANIGNRFSRQLYVNGERAIRARSEDNFRLYETKIGFISTCTDFSDWENVEDMEVLVNLRWRSTRIPVKEVCGKQLYIAEDVWNNHHVYNSPLFNKAPFSCLENSYKLIDNDKEWYIKKNGINNELYLKWDKGTPTNVTIPQIENFIIADYLNFVSFENLNFQYSTWNRPSNINNETNFNFGFIVIQADNLIENGVSSNVDMAVKFTNSSYIIFKNNILNKIGSTSIGFLKGSQNNIICGNFINDVSASGITLGEFRLNSNNVESEVALNNEILNNHILNIGIEYHSSVGILVSYAKQTHINNNKITNFPYTGISLGWGWNKDLDHSVNQVNNNWIECTSQILADGGGIYILSKHGNDNDKTQIYNNYILNQKYYRGAIYLDAGASYLDVKNNIIDANNDFNIINDIDCTIEIVRSFEYWYTSEYNNIENNIYNSKYYDPPNSSDSNNGCIIGPCQGNTVSNNTSFVNFNNHGINLSNIGPVINQCNN